MDGISFDEGAWEGGDFNFQKRNKMDVLGFIRDHVKNKTLALTTFRTDINDFTNIEALPELLASTPEATTFEISFQLSELDVQIMAEKYWKVLLAVIYCNTKDKILTICNRCAHDRYEHRDQRKVVDWSFTKNEYKRYKNVQHPGRIRKLDLQNLYSQSYSDTFYNAPVWEQVAIDHMIIPLFDLCSNEVTRFASIPFKCVQLTVDDSIRDSMLPSGSWTYFSKSEKLELHFDDVNARSYKIMRHNVLKLVKHPNLHVVLKWPIHVRDANPRQTGRDWWYGTKCWTLFDVENFVNQIAVLSVKSLTYTLSLNYGPDSKPPTVTFNCDEKFPSSFMKFLTTQRIYCGYKTSWSGDEGFLTLESARASFPT